MALDIQGTSTCFRFPMKKKYQILPDATKNIDFYFEHFEI